MRSTCVSTTAEPVAPVSSGNSTPGVVGGVARPRPAQLAAAPDPSDEQLMRRIADGDTQAIGLLYDRYSRLVYSQARRICAEDGLAEDTAQEVFLALWRNPGRFDPNRGRFSSWLLTVVHHKAVDAVRRENTARRRMISTTDEYVEKSLPAGPGADEAAMSSVMGSCVQDALNHLPAEQRRAIALAYYGGYTQREVAAITSVPLGTVKSRMYNATQQLRRLLMPLMAELGGQST
jgi:RNA polymerase sigma factor (sigma-70 family)